MTIFFKVHQQKYEKKNHNWKWFPLSAVHMVNGCLISLVLLFFWPLIKAEIFASWKTVTSQIDKLKSSFSHFLITSDKEKEKEKTNIEKNY